MHVNFSMTNPLGIETPGYWEACGGVIPVILWSKEGIFKYFSLTAICQGLIYQTDLLSWLLSLNWNLCRNFVLSLSVPTYQSSAQALTSLSVGVLWCSDERTPHGQEDIPFSLLQAEEHELRNVNTQLLKSKLLWPWQEGAVGQYPPRVLLPEFLLGSFSFVAVTTTVPENLGRCCFDWLLCQPCSLCLRKSERWLVWQPSLEHPETLEMETLVPKDVRGQERPMQSYIYLENFVL